MKNSLKTILALAVLLMSAPALAVLNILACEPEWGALAKELGGDNVTVHIATNARQDPHHIEARPSLIARARRADLVACTGAELEVGWLPLLQTQSGNPKIQAGQPGFFEAARYVPMLEVPQRVDRAQGDVHPGGNPHIQMSPYNIEKVAVALGERMSQIDVAEAPHYRSRTNAFIKRWREAIAGWEKRGAPLKGMPIVAHHKSFSYLNEWLGLRELGELEPKPGLPPTTSHLSALLARLRAEPAKAVVLTPYQDPQAAEWLSTRTRIPIVTLPFTVGGSDKATDLFALFDDTLSRLLAVTQ